ncbi:hypothetical protein E2C01_035008 [Portunus trituberculatus]|uniref:Uncharacterized protein n=1 Tax=Portunus trituberculatus TaxID=210409 RepID=A0A5B7F8I2_PORTR|nr:hypothetical protein [Portunus trituberculatus]
MGRPGHGGPSVPKAIIVELPVTNVTYGSGYVSADRKMRQRDMWRSLSSSPLFCKMRFVIPCPRPFPRVISFFSLYIKCIITSYLFTFLFYLLLPITKIYIIQKT